MGSIKQGNIIVGLEKHYVEVKKILLGDIIKLLDAFVAKGNLFASIGMILLLVASTLAIFL